MLPQILLNSWGDAKIPSVAENYLDRRPSVEMKHTCRSRFLPITILMANARLHHEERESLGKSTILKNLPKTLCMLVKRGL